MKHDMKLKPSPFASIVEGRKNIEMRLYDEKRQQEKVGDTIEFLNESTGESVCAKVLELHRYPTFKELYDKFDKVRLGYLEGDNAKPEDMEQYYLKEDIEKYGVVGIEIALVKKEGK